MRNLLFTKSDLKHTFRLLGKKPGFTLLSVLVLAGGLGISIVAITLSYTIFFKTLPITNGESIYHICGGSSLLNCRQFRAFEFAQLRQDISTLDNVGIYQSEQVEFNHQGQSFYGNATHTEWNMFQLTESSALIGRTLQPYDHDGGAEPVAVLAYDYWQYYFDGESEIIDSLLTLQGVPTRIVGVMPQGYRFPMNAELWMPISAAVLDPLENRLLRISTFGRLKTGVSEETASAEISNLMARLRQLYPSEFERSAACDSSNLECDTGHIASLPMAPFGGLLSAILIFLTSMVTGLIFLLACINVGTLLLARTNERMKDISIRVALGAPRQRLLLQTMGESIVITILGGITAVLFAGAFLEFLDVLFHSVGTASIIPFWYSFEINLATVLGAFVYVLCTVLITSALPCWRIVNGDFNAVMRDGTRGALGLRPGRFSRFLVVTSITMITLLLYFGSMGIGISLSIKENMLSLDSDKLLTVRPTLDPEFYTQSQRLQFLQSLHSILLTDPSIDNVLLETNLGSSLAQGETLGTANSDDAHRVNVFGIEGSLVTLGSSLLEGRNLNEIDTPQSQLTAMVSRTLAEQLWPGRTAVGQRIRIGEFSNIRGSSNDQWRQVVGVISDTPTTTEFFLLNASAIYLPLSQIESRGVTVVVAATDNSTTTLGRAETVMKQTIRELDSDLPFSRVANSEEEVGTLNMVFNFGMELALGCAAFAFLVSIAGIYGLTQNSIQLATQEIGTRRALGATDTKVSRTFLLRGSKQLLTGFFIAMAIVSPATYLFIIVGGGAFVESAFLSVFMTFAGLFVTVLLAIYQPIRNILNLEPIEALRHE